LRSRLRRRFPEIATHPWTNGESSPRVSIRENHANARTADSLRAVFERVAPPSDIGEQLWRRHWQEQVLVCMDRCERSAHPAATYLPEAVRRALRTGHAATWMRAHAAVDSSFSAADFVWYGTRSMYTDPTEARGLLYMPDAVAKGHFGLHHTSPDGRWVLDPFYAISLTSSGRPMRDVDSGFVVYDARSGNRVFYEVVGQAVSWATWLDAHTFLLLGSHQLLDYHAAAIWIGDVATGRVALYMGPPLSPLDRPRWSSALSGLQRAAYPRVRWDQ
jgi:hypothetical protein